jgi:hypothetical protein
MMYQLVLGVLSVHELITVFMAITFVTVADGNIKSH